VVNVELDTSATDLPPTVYGGWVLRGDQADRLSNVVGEDAPERCAPGRAVMLVEVRTPGGGASVWVNADDTAIHERLHERGGELLASLGVNAHRVPYLVADVRDLDQHGRPPERNAVCRCGSARKAKNCVHRGPPGFFSTGWLFLHQAEWDQFLAREDDFWRPDIPMMAPSHARIGVRHHTLANKSLATLTRDFAPGHPPFLPWTLLTETASTLSALVVDQLPFLREAKIWLTVTRPDRRPSGFADRDGRARLTSPQG
jgi:hypothetical protein